MQRARATSAAPPFFKPFVAPETNSEYVDGSKSHRCPAKVAYSEMRSIWPDVADLPPDIMLSVGTGKVEGEQIASDDPARPSSRSSRSIASTDISSITGSRRPNVSKSATMPVASGQILRSGRGGVGNYKRVETAPIGASDSSSLVQTGIFVRDMKTPLLLSFAPRQSAQGKAQDEGQDPLPNKSDGLYDHRRCESAWDAFVSGRGETHASRCSRICPELLASQIPKFEDAQRMEGLENDVGRALQQEEMVGSITLAAHRLVASTFFFEVEAGSIKQSPTGYACTGWCSPVQHRFMRTIADSTTGSIFCRFRQSSPELMALGSFLKSCCIGEFRPYFLIEDDVDGGTRKRRQIILWDAFILEMETAGYFDIEPLNITTAADKKETATSISLALQMKPYTSEATTICAALPISGFPRRLVTGKSESIAAKAVVTVPSPSAGKSSVLVIDQHNTGEVSTGGVSVMSSSPSRMSPDSVSPLTTYTLASRSSTGSASLSGVGLEKPQRHGEDVIAELPDHGSQAAELPSN